MSSKPGRSGARVVAALAITLGVVLACAPQVDAQDPSSPPTSTANSPPASLKDGIARVQKLCAQRRYQDAASLAESLTRDHRDEVEAWLTLASVHLSNDWPMRRDARAESAAVRALKVGGRRPDVLTVLAMAKHRQAKDDEALALVGELVDATPVAINADSLVSLLSMRAEVLFKMHALEPDARARALHDLDRAIAAQPSESQPRILRGEALLQDGKTPEAIADLDVALTDAPGSKQVHHLLQIALLKVGKREDARHHYEIWQRLNRLTDSLATASAPSPEDARRILRELKELNPADLSHRFDLARYELDLGAPDAAIAECDQLLALSPGWPAPAWLRAEALKAKSGGPSQSVAGVEEKER
jgi:tetratricopeptide (TPR) repeat protein